MWASYREKTDVVKELLSQGADISLQDNVRILYQVMLLEYTYMYLFSVLINSILKRICHTHSSMHTVSSNNDVCLLITIPTSNLLYEVPLRSLKVRLCVASMLLLCVITLPFISLEI